VVRRRATGRSNAAQFGQTGVRAKLSFGAALALAIGLLAVVLSATATAAEQVEVASFGTPGSEAGQLSSPGGVAVDQSSGDFYVADGENQRVDKFGPRGEFLLAWGWGVADGGEELQTCTTTCEAGLGGSGVGQMESPRGIAVAPGGDVYVMSTGDGRVQRFSPSGELEDEFGGYGEGEEQFSFGMPEANGIAVDSSGRVFVADQGHKPNARVAIFNSAGTLIGAVQNLPNRRLESFGALAIGPDDELLVGSIAEGGVYVYSAAGAFERLIGRGLTVIAVTVNPDNGNVLVESTKGFSPTTYTLSEFLPSGRLVGAEALAVASSETSFHASIGLAYDANPAADVPGSLPGLVLAADANGSRVLGLAEATPEKPTVSGVGVGGNNGDGINVNGTVEPRGLATEYFVRWGATPAYGQTSPRTALPANRKAEHATVHLFGLTPGTTYHYSLVAVNALGEEASADQAFTTLAAGSPFALPDGRAYELVSQNKGNNDVEAHGLATADGGAVSFTSLNGLPGAEVGALLGASVATRGAAGWATTPASAATENEATILAAAPLAFSADLRQDLVQSTLNLTGNAPRGNNIFLRTNPSAPGQPAGEQLVTPETGRYNCPNEPLPVMAGASADFSHLFFTDGAALTPDSTPIEGVSECALPQLYEWSGGTLRNVGILPGESTPSPTGATVAAGGGMVSADGSTVFFNARPEVETSAGPVPTQLYVRTGGRTVRVSEPRIPTAEPNAQGAKFQAASADGSVVYFTTATRLTADASPAGADLYRYVVASGELTDLTPDQTDPGGAEARQAVTTPDGGLIYFGAAGALAPGATPEGSNLYRMRIGAAPEFIGELAPNDSMVSTSPFQPVQLETRMTADGNVLLLASAATLGSGAEETGTTEIYRYVAGQGFTCVSCADRGEAVSGAQVKSPGFPGSPGGNVLSADGSRVFFETADALVPQDNNGKLDVYEWEGGQVHLISTGSSGEESNLLDADPSGADVFFTTRQQLVKADQDEKVDVYDARVGGGFAEAAPVGPPCEAEACRPPSAAAPPAAQLGSRSFVGPKNKKPARKKHGKKKHAKHRKKQQKHKHQKKKAKHHKHQHGKQHSTGKRG
jgi:hypothetical protein